jgi:hypothetical protein
MAMCASIDANGYVKSNTTPVNECTGVVLVSPAEFAMNYQASGYTVEDYSSVLFGSFGFVFIIAALGFKISTASNLVRRI